MGKLRTGTKSDLVGCLEDLVPTHENAPNPTVLSTGQHCWWGYCEHATTYGAAKTFSDYVEKQVFSPYIKSQLHHVSRLDVVWDKCLPESSLKAETRRKRGKGVRRHVEPFSAIPGKWGDGCSPWTPISRWLGVKRGRTQVDGKFTGPHRQKRPRPVGNSSTVDVKRCAEDSEGSTSVHCPLPLLVFYQ